jgi:hypothetical protein
MGYVLASLFPNVDSRLQVHAASLAGCCSLCLLVGVESVEKVHVDALASRVAGRLSAVQGATR